MSSTERVQLLDALAERDVPLRRRSVLVAWTSVLVAGAVLALMIQQGRSALIGVKGEVDKARAELTLLVEERARLTRELVTLEAEAATVKREALASLQPDADPDAVEQFVDRLINAAPEGTSVEPATGRERSIAKLFDSNSTVRIAAYGDLLPRYEDDPTLIPEVIRYARANSENANGIYNSLVVLSHMNADTLRPYATEITSLANQSRGIGTRVSERADTLLARLPE